MERKKVTREYEVDDYSVLTMDEIESEFIALHELSKQNLDIGAIDILRQSMYVIMEQLELVSEMKKRTGLSEKELNKLFGPVKIG